MNKESIKLWLALLREWLDEIGCEDIIEHPMRGFHFTCREMNFWVGVGKVREGIYIHVLRYGNLSVVTYCFGDHMKFSEVDICNPDITPSERFRVLEQYIETALGFLKGALSKEQALQRLNKQ